MQDEKRPGTNKVCYPIGDAPKPLNCLRQIAAARAQRDNAVRVWTESMACGTPECLLAVINAQAEFKDAYDALQVLEPAQAAGVAPCEKQ